MVVIQLEIPLETVEEAVRVARDYGARVILNPAPARLPSDAGLLPQVDYLVPNEHELEQLTGRSQAARWRRHSNRWVSSA